MRNGKGLKPQTILLIGALLLIAVMIGISQIPSKSAEPVSLPTNWFETIKPGNLVDFGVVPQEKQVFELEAGKVAQFFLQPGQTATITPKKGTLIIGFVSLTGGDAKLTGTFDPQKAEMFTLHEGKGQRLIYVMSQLPTTTEFEVGPAALNLAP